MGGKAGSLFGLEGLCAWPWGTVSCEKPQQATASHSTAGRLGCSSLHLATERGQPYLDLHHQDYYTVQDAWGDLKTEASD